jgi:hypothetical protein
MSILENKIYYINSDNRLSGTASDFIYEIQIPDGIHYDHACVLSMSIPRSFYLVRRDLNQFEVVINGVTYSAEVPIGNYNVLNFRGVIENILNQLSSYVWTVTYNSIKATYTYTCTGAASFIFSSKSYVAEQMGYAVGSTGEIGEAPNVACFVSSTTLFLHSDMVNDDTHILQELMCENTPPLSHMSYQCRDALMYSKKLKINSNTSAVSFTLTDERNHVINLNGRDLLVTLLLYRKQDTQKMFRDFVELQS